MILFKYCLERTQYTYFSCIWNWWGRTSCTLDIFKCKYFRAHAFALFSEYLRNRKVQLRNIEINSCGLSRIVFMLMLLFSQFGATKVKMPCHLSNNCFSFLQPRNSSFKHNSNNNTCEKAQKTTRLRRYRNIEFPTELLTYEKFYAQQCYLEKFCKAHFSGRRLLHMCGHQANFRVYV